MPGLGSVLHLAQVCASCRIICWEHPGEDLQEAAQLQAVTDGRRERRGAAAAAPCGRRQQGGRLMLGRVPLMQAEFTFSSRHAVGASAPAPARSVRVLPVRCLGAPARLPQPSWLRCRSLPHSKRRCRSEGRFSFGRGQPLLTPSGPSTQSSGPHGGAAAAGGPAPPAGRPGLRRRRPGGGSGAPRGGPAGRPRAHHRQLPRAQGGRGGGRAGGANGAVPGGQSICRGSPSHRCN